MINPKHLEGFVSRVMGNLPDSLTTRKQDLVTLLALLPKNFHKRDEVIMALEALRAHEVSQLKFKQILDGHDGHNGGQS